MAVKKPFTGIRQVKTGFEAVRNGKSLGIKPNRAQAQGLLDAKKKKK